MVPRFKPPPELSERARAFVDAVGIQRTAKILGVAPATTAKLVAGLPVRESTLRLVAASLRARDAVASGRRIP